jgi:zinc finger CCHC domain-containing protein 8
MDEDIFNESELFSTFDSVENGDKNAAFNCSQVRSESANLSELDSLKLENMLLKKLVKKISFNPSEDEPFANILFYKSACKKQREVEDFICHVVKRSAQNNNTQDLNETSVLKDGFAIALGQDYADLPVGCVQYFTSFCLDKFGSDIENVFPDPPSYDKAYYKTLPEQAGVSQNRRMLSCFNCDGDHKLADCPKPRDLARISMRRRERGMNESRYHKGQDQLKLYQHLKPGIISDTLREALGMSDHDLPPYIYRMRLLDYPSGWLPGSQDHSGIVMYGKEGREEQIIKREDSDDHVHYPGFNVPIPDGKMFVCLLHCTYMKLQILTLKCF